MSKEVSSSSDANNTNDLNVDLITQEYSFWARLMTISDHIDSEVFIQYPSFTSTLSQEQQQQENQQRHGFGDDHVAIVPNNIPAWQSLTSTVHLMNAPPIVELLE
jgi:hypothetical protein